MKVYKLLWLLLFFPLTVEAVGISVTPSSIELLSPDVASKKISVKNISAEPIIVRIYADDFSDNIRITPAEFDLLPEEVSPVSIDGDFDNLNPGVKKTNISVLSQAKDQRSFNAISGLKIPVSIYITDSYFKWSGPAVFVVVFLGLGIILILAYLLFNIFQFRPKKNKFAGLDFLLHHKKKWYKWW